MEEEIKQLTEAFIKLHGMVEQLQKAMTYFAHQKQKMEHGETFIHF